MHFYELHNTIRVASAVPLADLDRFEVGDCRAEPELRVIVGRPPRHDYPGVSVALSGGRLTACVRRPQAWAPRLLYASVVEPLLQRLYFDRGYALVHAACVDQSGRGMLILGGPGDGKTTLSLALARRGGGFLGDDMIVLAEGGRALAFPKHVKLPSRDGQSPRRGWRRDAALAIRRGVHSRSSGVRRAFRHRNLPVAGVNALIQALVPAPRLDCADIVPDIELVESVRLERVLIVGGDLDRFTCAPVTAVARRLARSTEAALRGQLWNEVADAHAPRTDDLAARVETLLPRRFELTAAP